MKRVENSGREEAIYARDLEYLVHKNEFYLWNRSLSSRGLLVFAGEYHSFTASASAVKSIDRQETRSIRCRSDIYVRFSGDDLVFIGNYHPFASSLFPVKSIDQQQSPSIRCRLDNYFRVPADNGTSRLQLNYTSVSQKHHHPLEIPLSPPITFRCS